MSELTTIKDKALSVKTGVGSVLGGAIGAVFGGLPGAAIGATLGGFAAHADRCNTDAEFESDQMIRLVHRGIVARCVCDETVLVKAAPHVIAVGGKRHIHPPAQVAEYRASVALDARDYFDLARMVQLAAGIVRAQHARQIIDAARGESQALRRRRKPRCIGDRGHLKR